MINATIGRYRIVGVLGQGGMGVVYHGHDPVLNRPAAIKILSQQLIENPEAEMRFLREAQSAARLNHPNIVAIYDIAEHEGIFYLVLEFISGSNLDMLIKQANGPIELSKALEIFVPLCQALDYAHQNGVVHRDVKPGNVMVTNKGEVKLADFGIASLEMSQTLTQPGQMIGSCLYLSPEQARGEKVDRRADIYSLGIVFYEMLTGRVPYLADNIAAVIQQHLTAKPTPLREIVRGIPQSINDVVLKCMAKDPDKRFQSASELIEALKTDLRTPEVQLSRKANIRKPEAQLSRKAEETPNHPLDKILKEWSEWVSVRGHGSLKYSYDKKDDVFIVYRNGKKAVLYLSDIDEKFYGEPQAIFAENEVCEVYQNFDMVQILKFSGNELVLSHISLSDRNGKNMMIIEAAVPISRINYSTFDLMVQEVAAIGRELRQSLLNYKIGAF